MVSLQKSLKFTLGGYEEVGVGKIGLNRKSLGLLIYFYVLKINLYTFQDRDRRIQDSSGI